MRLVRSTAVLISAAALAAAADRVFSPVELQSDLATLRSLLEYNHPGLYAWTDRAAFEAHFDAAFAAASRDMDAVEFLAVLQPLVARVGCGHTRIMAPAGMAAASARVSIPVTFLFTRGECRVRQSLRLDESIAPGSRVVSVNGTPAEALHERLMEFMPADGPNRSRKTWLVNYNAQSVALGAIFGFPEQYEIALVPPGESEVRVAAVPARGIADLQAISPKVYPPQPREAFTLSWIPERNAAVLRVRTFDRASWGDFEGMLGNMFDALAQSGAENLIVDVRGNGGGAPETAAALLRYIAREPFVYFARAMPVYAALLGPLPPRPNAFRGRVYVLADGGCFSTTGHFLSLIRYHGLAEIVGEESGASFSCNDAHLSTALPHTGFPLWVARYTFETAVDGLPRGRGIAPDYELSPAAEDILAGRDAVLEFTLDLIGVRTAPSAQAASSARHRPLK